MEFDYFYGQQAEQFSFYRVPKVLFTDDRFWNVSADAKLLYGIFLDRMNLSAKNGLMDEQGRVYIIFTIEDIQAALNCGDNKATKLLRELEDKCGLIERKRQGLGKPNLIYVKNFISDVDTLVEKRFLNRQNDDSRTVKNTIQESSKTRCNNTDNKDIDYSNTDPFYPSGDCGLESDGMGTAKSYREYFLQTLEYKILYERHPYDRDTLEEILSLLVDTMCTKRKMIRIAGDDKPADVVKSQFMKLGLEHISYVLDCLNDNSTSVRNPRQYLLAALYNATMTMSSYYGMKVRHDMAKENF